MAFEEGSPIHRLSYTPMFESADVVGGGALAVELYLGLSNMFEQDFATTHYILMDMERLITAPTLRFGITDRLEIGGRVTLETRGGGVLDGFLLWYHDLFGFSHANRDRFPSNGYDFLLADDSEVYVDVEKGTFEPEDVRLYGKWVALRSEDGRSALSLRPEARIPTGSNAVGDERTDIGLTALGKLGVGSWYLHGMLGASTLRSSPRLDPVLNDHYLFFALGLERALFSSVAAVVQYQVTSAALRGFDDRELDWPATNLVFGVAGRAGDSWRWDVSFQEDVPADAPSVDFTLGIRLARYWH